MSVIFIDIIQSQFQQIRIIEVGGGMRHGVKVRSSEKQGRVCVSVLSAVDEISLLLPCFSVCYDSLGFSSAESSVAVL